MLRTTNQCNVCPNDQSFYYMFLEENSIEVMNQLGFLDATSSVLSYLPSPRKVFKEKKTQNDEMSSIFKGAAGSILQGIVAGT